MSKNDNNGVPNLSDMLKSISRIVIVDDVRKLTDEDLERIHDQVIQEEKQDK